MITVQGSGSASQGEVSFLSWNSKVQHILASTSYNGTTGEEVIKLNLYILFSLLYCPLGW
jgi:protein transport protein SEC31